MARAWNLISTVSTGCQTTSEPKIGWYNVVLGGACRASLSEHQMSARHRGRGRIEKTRFARAINWVRSLAARFLPFSLSRLRRSL